MEGSKDISMEGLQQQLELLQHQVSELQSQNRRYRVKKNSKGQVLFYPGTIVQGLAIPIPCFPGEFQHLTDQVKTIAGWVRKVEEMPYSTQIMEDVEAFFSEMVRRKETGKIHKIKFGHSLAGSKYQSLYARIQVVVRLCGRIESLEIKSDSYERSYLSGVPSPQIKGNNKQKQLEFERQYEENMEIAKQTLETLGQLLRQYTAGEIDLQEDDPESLYNCERS